MRKVDVGVERVGTGGEHEADCEDERDQRSRRRDDEAEPLRRRRALLHADRDHAASSSFSARPSAGRAARGPRRRQPSRRRSALVEHDQPVGERQQLVEVLADEQHGGAALALGEQLRRGRTRSPPTSRPRVGWETTIACGSRESTRASSDLLDVAARQRRRRRRQAAPGSRSGRSAPRRCAAGRGRPVAARGGTRPGARGRGCAPRSARPRLRRAGPRGSAPRPPRRSRPGVAAS